MTDEDPYTQFTRHCSREHKKEVAAAQKSKLVSQSRFGENPHLQSCASVDKDLYYGASPANFLKPQKVTVVKKMRKPLFKSKYDTVN